MAKRDIDLIVALAEGRLEDEAEARSLIEGSARLRAIYEAQTRALEATSNLSPATLTELERSTLRRDLWTSLTTEPSPAAPARSGWGMQRAGYVAGAAVLVVGLAVALGQLGTAGQEDAAAFDRALTSGGSEGEGSHPATESAPAQGLLNADTVDLFSGYANLARSGDLQYRVAADAETIDIREAGCLEKAGLEDHVILGEVTLGDGGETGSPYLVSAAESSPLGPGTQIAFIDSNTCELVFVDD